MTELENIFKALENLKEARKTYELLNKEYIKKNVDLKNFESLDKAICELPESEYKLFLYDAMYDLKNP